MSNSPRDLAARLRALTVAVAASAACAGSPLASADSTERAGDVVRVALPAAAFALTLRRDDPEGRRQFYRSFGANVLATWALKETFDKKRPNDTSDDAFPSGHASMAFHGAAFLHRRYGIRPIWPAYFAAAFVAWSRVDADAHDTADVLAGAGVGVASAFMLAQRRDLKVAASASSDGGAFSVVLAFR